LMINIKLKYSSGEKHGLSIETKKQVLVEFIKPVLFTALLSLSLISTNTFAHNEIKHTALACNSKTNELQDAMRMLWAQHMEWTYAAVTPMQLIPHRFQQQPVD
ncbi:MAG: hypothetical protein L0G58_11545, partial [Acinetobacter sp.]|nr:hypothetical protein [Acinetobacter sp.]